MDDRNILPRLSRKRLLSSFFDFLPSLLLSFEASSLVEDEAEEDVEAAAVEKRFDAEALDVLQIRR